MKRALFMALAFGIIGCGGSDNGTGGGGGSGGGGGTAGGASCTVSSGGVQICEEYGNTATAATVMQACSQAQGTYSTSGCSHSNLAGSCTITSGTLSYTEYFYSPVTSATAMQLCTASGGKFSSTSESAPGGLGQDDPAVAGAPGN